MRRFYAPKQNFSDSQVKLDADETRHLRDVLRLKTGDAASVFDGEGGEFEGVISIIGKKESMLDIRQPVGPPAAESPIELTLAVSLLKGEKFDLVTQKAVELGVAKLIPLETARADVRAGDGDKRQQRWQKIALGATKQCGRAKLMHVAKPIRFNTFAGTAESPVYFFTERDGTSLPADLSGQKITAVIGPEGGWEDSEIEFARKCGFELVTLGGRILRAETAAIVIAALLQHRFGDLN
ncbi:MAG: 16S rRNA (uracil(1498)-N(3))-methyltransferase [Acidobacteriota bacterium]